MRATPYERLHMLAESVGFLKRTHNRRCPGMEEADAIQLARTILYIRIPHALSQNRITPQQAETLRDIVGRALDLSAVG